MRTIARLETGTKIWCGLSMLLYMVLAVNAFGESKMFLGWLFTLSIGIAGLLLYVIDRKMERIEPIELWLKIVVFVFVNAFAGALLFGYDSNAVAADGAELANADDMQEWY